jgi:membrane fusion protein (multidrug efflux system)
MSARGGGRSIRGALGVLVLAAIAALVGCDGGAERGDVEFRVPVTVRDVGTGDVEDRIVTTGTLRAEEVVTLRADTAGVLVAARDAEGRRLHEGDRVEAGQTIAEITGEDVRIAARTDATEARYKEALRDFESKRRLYEEELISEAEFRNSEAALADAKLEWERSRLTESRSRLVTPIAGVVLSLARDEQGMPLADGQLVSQGFVVAQIAPVRRLIADVDLIGPDVTRVAPGMPVRIRHQAAAGAPFEGRVLRLAPALDSVTRTLRAEVEVANERGILRPGMFVEVTIVAERRPEVPVVPRDAVTEREGGKVVFVLEGQKVAQRAVVLGLGDDEQVEVREGLEPGERIVVRGLETLTDGARVRVTNG